MPVWFKLSDLVTMLALAFGGLLLGIIFEKTFLANLLKISSRNRWKGNELIVKAFQGKTKWVFMIVVLYGGSLNLTIDPRYLIIFHKFLQLFLILLMTSLAAKIAMGLVDLYSQHEAGFLPSVSIFTNLARILVYILGILIALQALGISISPILTALGVGGLAVALALQDTLSNLFSGLQIIASRQIKPGDYIKLGSGEEGFVADISWKNTSIRALSNNLIIIPNATLAKAIITNYQKPDKELSVPVEISVGYGSDLARVEAITIAAAREVLRDTPGGIKEFEPLIRYSAFGDSGINFTVILRGLEFTDQFLLKHELLKKLYQRYREEGIIIPYPTRTVFLNNEDK